MLRLAQRLAGSMCCPLLGTSTPDSRCFRAGSHLRWCTRLIHRGGVSTHWNSQIAGWRSMETLRGGERDTGTKSSCDDRAAVTAGLVQCRRVDGVEIPDRAPSRHWDPSSGKSAVVEESSKGLVIDVGDPVCQSYGGLRLG